jgi:hypothetical protein
MENYKYYNMELFETKYNMKFNADCQGALYYILKDKPIFKRLKTILIENDFTDITHQEFVDEESKRFNFKLVYRLAGGLVLVF